MKIFASFLLLIFGLAAKGMAQGDKTPVLKFDQPLVLPNSKFELPENLKSFIPDTSGVDSKIPSLPRTLSMDGEIKSVSPIPYQSRMPIQILPDPDSRMPIKEFGDSINYTILKKEF